MASYQAFNGIMQEFLDELIETFPEEKALKVENIKFQTLKKSNPRKVVEGFMSAVSKYTENIMKKDEMIMKNADIDFLNKINISKWWNDDLSNNTKDAIWQYLNTLIMLGTTITSIPQDMLKQIENVAEQCASQMGNTESIPNMGSLFAGLQSIMGNMDSNIKKK